MGRKSASKEESASEEGKVVIPELLDLVLNQIKEDYPEGVLYQESKEDLKNLPKYSTGVLSIDQMIGNYGGIPGGRTMEIFGNPAAGKSTLALHLTAEIHKRGGFTAYFDLENALNLEVAEKIGVKVDSPQFLIFHPEDGEQGLQIIDKLIRSNELGLIVVDSIAALTSTKESSEGFGAPHMGGQARMLSQFLKIATSLLARPKHKTLLLLLNQTRMNITGYGNPNTTSGGKAPQFYASLRVEMKVKEILKNGNGEPYAQVVNLKTVKNKIGLPFRETEAVLRFGEGFDQISDLIRLADAMAVIVKKGAWYQYGEEKFQGEDNLRQWILDQNKSQEIREKILSIMGEKRD